MNFTIKKCTKCNELPTVENWNEDPTAQPYWVASCPCGTVEDTTLFGTLQAWNEMDWATNKCEPDCYWCQLGEKEGK